MKDLLEKLTRATVDITLKSGEELYDVVIERIVGNTVIANYGKKPTRGYEEKCERSGDMGKGRGSDRRITLIDIGHVASVSAEKGIMELMKIIVSNREDTGDGKKENKKEDKK